MKRTLAVVLCTSLTMGVGISAATAVNPPALAPEAQSSPDQLTTEVDVEGFTGKVTATLEEDGRLTLRTHPNPGSELGPEILDVTSFLITGQGEDDFDATVRSRTTGSSLSLGSVPEVVTTRAVPVLIVLGLVARVGLKWALKKFTKAQIKKAAKSYLLNNVDKNKWAHIMAPKHKWSSVGAKSREQVAELMARAMAEGKHGKYGKNGKSAVWNYNGKTIEVTYSNGGHISNGWVR